MPPKSIWRSKDAQHFTLVHRSQRDPLIHDPDASSRVLAPTQRGQRAGAKGAPVSRSELEDEYKTKERPNVGEAAAYGVYFDDTEYDYMQHLRVIGGNYNAQRGGKDEEEDVDVVMLPGPAAKDNNKGKAKAGGNLEFKDDQKEALQLPAGAFASKEEMQRDWARGTQEDQKGLRLEMDPHLRQVLEALDDEAFLAGKRREHEAGAGQVQVESEAGGSSSSAASNAQGDASHIAGEEDFVEGDDDDFDALFSEVIAGGEFSAAEGNNAGDAWRSLPPEGDESLYLTAADKAKRKLAEGGGDFDSSELSLSERVALFKEGLAPGAGSAATPPALTSLRDDAGEGKSSRKPRTAAVPSSTGGSSIFGEGAPGKRSKPGSKARHAMSFYAPSADGGSTAWSMSSSAMARNAGLRNVDDGFDRMEQIYEGGEEDEYDDEDDDGTADGYGDEDGEDNVVMREDFETILDEFLNNKEVVAGKVRQRLGGRDATGAEKLDILRKEVGQARIDQWLQEREETQEEIDRDIEGRIRVVGMGPKDWDVETIQTTKTNVSNHPRVLSSVGGSSSFARPGVLGSGGSSVNGSAASSSSTHSSSSSSAFESIPKVRVNKRTGATEIVGWTRQRKQRGGDAAEAEDDAEAAAEKIKSLNINIDDDDDGEGAGSPPPAHSSDEDTETESNYAAATRTTIKRDRNESAEDKKARKDAAKAEKQGRKLQKARRKEEFAMERKRQVKMDAGRVKDGGAADVRVGAAKRLN